MTHLKLTVRHLTAKDYGPYRCVAKNPRGETDGTIKIYRKSTDPSIATGDQSAPKQVIQFSVNRNEGVASRLINHLICILKLILICSRRSTWLEFRVPHLHTKSGWISRRLQSRLASPNRPQINHSNEFRHQDAFPYWIAVIYQQNFHNNLGNKSQNRQRKRSMMAEFIWKRWQHFDGGGGAWKSCRDMEISRHRRRCWSSVRRSWPDF